MWISQEMRGTKPLDHDHETGEIRGILCHECNRGLGYFKDNTHFLQSASIYLSKPFPVLPTNLSESAYLDSMPTRKEKMRAYVIKSRYKISAPIFFWLLEQFQYECEICLTEIDGMNPDISYDKKAVVDHDHGSGQVRGLLCHACNSGLGMLVTADNIRRAANYLESPPARAWGELPKAKNRIS